MVNKPIKPNKTNSNTINSVLADNKPFPKSKQQIDKEYYQKNKERKKTQQKERYLQKKDLERQQLTKYYNMQNYFPLL